MAINVQLPTCVKNKYPRNKQPKNIITFKACLAGMIKAFPEIISDNLPNAIIDPVNVIAPINTPKNTSTL